MHIECVYNKILVLPAKEAVPVKERTLQSLDQIESVTPLQVIGDNKNISLLVEISQPDQISKALYYPERGVRLTLDERIPKPFEVYHHVAFFELSQMLGWHVVIQAIPFSLRDDDHGSLSPYFEEVTVKPHYYYESLDPSQVWMQLAVIDYLGGLVDRNSNDILFLPNGQVLATDNGLSFVEGIVINSQISVVRNAMRGVPLTDEIMADLEKINKYALSSLSELVYDAEHRLPSVVERRDLLLEAGEVL